MIVTKTIVIKTKLLRKNKLFFHHRAVEKFDYRCHQEFAKKEGFRL